VVRVFVDRAEAGLRLADLLAAYPHPRPLVLALPRGGVPVGAEIASRLDADLDVLVVRKLGVPGNPEFAMGALGEDGALVIDHHLRRQLHISSEQVDQIAAEQGREIERRVLVYRGGRDKLGVAGRNVIIVDDGMATGATAAAAVSVVDHQGASHVTVAAPVASAEAVEWLRTLADDVICLDVPSPFMSVGRHYGNFEQVSDHEVIRLLSAHPRRDAPLAASGDVVDGDVIVEAGPHLLAGHLHVPAQAKGIVLFAHGSGSGRLSPRNIAVAKALNGAGLGTLLLDLLTDHEADNRRNVFDIELLADRLVLATRWIQAHPARQGARIGYYGASTGAAAALVAEAKIPGEISAVVSRGGRPDLAGDWLANVTAPTLLIVGGNDYQVIDLNREAQRQLRCTNLLEIVPGATHLFEAGTLAQVSRLAQTWFVQYMC
jgi:predicted phosphoribosyltransferase/dienelactone hydrolase